MRRFINDETPRLELVKARVTQDEKRQLVEAAKARKMSLAEMIRSLANTVPGAA